MRKIATYLLALLLSLPMLAQKVADPGVFLDAITKYSNGQFEEARIILDLLHKMVPEDDAVSYYLALCEFGLKDTENSEKHFKEAVAADSTNAWYLHSLASLYNATGERMRSAELCEKLLKMKPSMYNNSYTLTLIGDAKLRAQQDSAALHYYEQALKIDPEYAPAELSKIEILRYQGKYPQFFSTLNHFIQNEDVIPDIKTDYIKDILDKMDARFYWVWGEQLGNLVGTCITVHPDLYDARFLKMQLLYIKEDYDGIIEVTRQMERIGLQEGNNDHIAEALSTRGDVLHQQGKAKAAYECYTNALRFKPEYPAVLNNYAYYLSEEGRKLKKALEMSRKACEIEPDNATYLDTLGWILYLLKKPEEAKPLFKHAMIYGGKDSAVVLEHYAKVLQALGEKDLSLYYQGLADQKNEKR